MRAFSLFPTYLYILCFLFFFGVRCDFIFFSFITVSSFYLCLFLGRLGRKSCSNTMCKSYGNPEVCLLLHSQLRQTSRSSTNGDQVLHREVSSRLGSEFPYHPPMWVHAGILDNWLIEYSNIFLIVLFSGAVLYIGDHLIPGWGWVVTLVQLFV